MAQESKKNDSGGVVGMGEIVRMAFLLTFVIMILDPLPTLWERVLFCTVMLSAGIFFGYIFRKIKLWQIARAAESQKT
ncbi:MAG: hypothetical protein F4X56_03970 [Gammaproteobacteria bacterium]|nr:hypothetical protein [Gammaproteobacteria bacterium]